MEKSNLALVWEKFHKTRVVPLFDRFPGYYRAEVVETNDPLQWHRIRFKCPEIHDHDLQAKDCPWADTSPALGGKNAGSWTSPMIGDIVWITWEKNHPYGPIWVGFAMGTRRKRYPLEAIYIESPLAVKEDETADEKPNDYLPDYLAMDRRPMSLGWRDRYGNSEFCSSVGFFPIEHKSAPAELGYDAVSMSQFKAGQGQPQVNMPDRKYAVKISKYGHYQIHSDVGYYWQKNDKGNEGEFKGDADKDRDFEIKRYKYLTRLLNEDKPNSADRDQRRYEIRTRAGHKFEMRDVGYAQKGGGLNVCTPVTDAKSRQDEYDTPRVLSKWAKTDERWIKWRSKGGHIIQAMDMGFHPEEDKFYMRKLIDETGPDVDEEMASDWVHRDARQIRILTRWGSKFVLDDRGTDGRDAEGQEKPRGNGWLLKTRRSWQDGGGSPRGFSFDANDKDELDTSRWVSPKSKVVELNDRKDYVMVCTDTKTEISEPWKKLKENEFPLKIAMTEDPEQDTYHLKLDKHNGYLRLKTAAGHDNGRRPDPEGLEAAQVGLNQGLEARDGRCSTGGPWVEIVDQKHRGIWFVEQEKMGIWRAKQGADGYIFIHDGKNQIVIRNNMGGKLQIFCQQDVEIISQQNIALKANGKISFKAGQEIDFEVAGSSHAKLTSGAWKQDVEDLAPSHPIGSESCNVLDPQPLTQEKKEPDDRAVVCNEAPAVPLKVIRICS